jgi:transcriptional regulator with XRE-family HTH domain
MLDSAPDSMTMSLELGRRLKQVRELNGLSQRELAKRAKVTHSSISMIEQGQNSPSVHSLEKILNAIPMSLAQFFAADSAQSHQVVYRCNELVSDLEKSTNILNQYIPHKNSSHSLRFKKTVLGVGADTGIQPAFSNQCISGVVVSGQLELTASLLVTQLFVGDAFSLPVKYAYRLRNLSLTEECVLLVCEV